VLEAMGVDAHRSLRLSVGWDTLDADIEAVVENLPSIIGSLRALTGRNGTNINNTGSIRPGATDRQLLFATVEE
jgi:hypothetical protein